MNTPVATANPMAAVLAGERRAAMRAAFPPRSLALLRRAASLVRENSAAAVRSLAGSAGGQLPADRWEI